MNQDGECPVLDRIEQQRNFGIDCGNEILFGAGTWAPGGEHTRKLHVKNVSNRTLKFKYDLPRTKYFSMDFPILITLSPGTSRVFDVAFRPVQYEIYDDFIRLQVHIIDGGVKATSGSFRLPVKARISTLNMEIPNGIDFGFCPTAETTEYKFYLKSTGQIDGSFQWRLPDAGEHGRPILIRPSTGDIKAGQTLEMTAAFSPQNASVYVVTASLIAQERQGETNQRQEYTMKISGIGKYAYFSASESELEFGELLVGATNNHKHPTEKEFVLRNRSLVRASFQIVPVESDHEPLFFFSPLQGVIPPEASIPITVKYTPLSPGTFTCDNFKIKTPGGHSIRVTCRGKAIGPLVSLWKKNLASNLIKATSINFKDVEVGSISTRVLILKNESDISVRYNFMAAPNGVFEIDKVTGVVPPLLESSIMLTFRPQIPGNFYRRLFLLVQNQSTLYVDILGTGYDDEVRPSPFQQAHVDAYRLRCEHHWGHLSPDGLERLLEDKGDTYFLHGALRAAASSKNESEPRLLTRSGESLLQDVAISNEFFRLPTDRSHAISVSETLIEFGNHSGKKSLVVTNHTKGKVTCGWRISDPNSFHITPSTYDIAPGTSCEFLIHFNPLQKNTYYFGEFESHIYFKTNRTFRLVNIETFTPPWCIIIHANGHTFHSNDNQFLSKVYFLTTKKNICPFPPVHLGDSVYQTITLLNSNDTPALFSIQQDPTMIFFVHPSSGLIPSNGFHLIQIRFTPIQPRRYQYYLKTIINYTSTITLELTGMGCRPKVLCHDIQGQTIERIYIKPTAIGLSSTRNFYLHNASRIPLIYRWQIPRSMQSIIQLSPIVQRLAGNQSQFVTCVFSPTQMKQYNQRILVHVKSISKGLNEKSNQVVVQETSVKLLGIGTSGAISFVPNALKLPTVLVNSPTSSTFHIINSSDCDLRYELHVHIRSATITNVDACIPRADSYINFSKPSGVIGARSKQEIEITFRANLAGMYHYDIACDVATNDMNQFLTDMENIKMAVEASASFPTLVLEDIRLLQISTTVAWSQFQVESINSFLLAPLTNDELKWNAESSPDMSSITTFHLNFTPAIVGSPTEEVWIQLRNPGSLVVSFRIFYPNESDVELEPWADRGEPTAEELRQNIIIDSKLFTITPRTGVLEPHQSLLLCISYSYVSMQYEGIHDLPVMLNVAQGKKVTLILNGKTLPPSTPHLFLHTTRNILSPVMLGESTRKAHDYCKPSLQQIPVLNSGDRPVKVDIDDGAFTLVNANQFNFPILYCLTSQLIIPARSCGYIDVEFCPLEDRTYVAELELLAEGVDTAYQTAMTLTVVAKGYHPSRTTFQEAHKVLGGPPSKQLLYGPMLQKAELSQDRVEFGIVNVRSENHRVIVLTNVSKTATLNFEWDESHPLIKMRRVRCLPMQGKLLPLQHVMVRVSVLAQDDLRVINHDIPCLIRVLSDIAPSNLRTSQESKSESNAIRPSVITRSTISSRSHFNRGSDNNSSGGIEQSSKLRATSPKSNRGAKSKWKIGNTLDHDAPALKPPVPVFLRVFAHIVPLDVFQRQFTPQQYSRHPLSLLTKDVRFIDSLSTLRRTWAIQDARVARESRHVIESVMGHLLSDLIQSGSIIQAMEELQVEPETPRFVQFRSTLKKKHSRRLLHNDDLKRLTISILENTMFNLVQEISCGDFDLACLPKQLVFNPSTNDEDLMYDAAEM